MFKSSSFWLHSWHFARACPSYECFILRATRLSCQLLGHGFVRERLKSPFWKFYRRYEALIKHYEVPFSQILYGIPGHEHIYWHPHLIRHYIYLWPYYRTGAYYWLWYYYQVPIAMGAASEQRTLTPPDTRSCPIWDLYLFLSLDHFLLNFLCFRTSNFYYPSILRCCFCS